LNYAILTFILVAFSMQCATAQQTWHDLHFGMSPAEAKAILKDQLRDDKARLTELFLAMDMPSVAAEGVTGQGALAFDKSTLKLKGISLALSAGFRRAKEDHSCAAPPDAIIDAVSGFTRVSDRLIFNYGQPIIQSPEWPSPQRLQDLLSPSSPPFTGARRVWKAQQQLIEESIHAACGLVTLWITYKPDEKGEL
jgi:hypothetical protein